MSFYGEMAQLASELLAEFGAPVTIKRNVVESHNPVNGQTVYGDPLTFNPNGIFKNYPQKLIDGIRITEKDKMLILESGVLEPQMGDLVVSGNQEWPIQEIEEVTPTNTPLIYMVRIRK